MVFWLIASAIVVALVVAWLVWPMKEEIEEQALWGPKPYENHFPHD